MRLEYNSWLVDTCSLQVKVFEMLNVYSSSLRVDCGTLTCLSFPVHADVFGLDTLCVDGCPGHEDSLD